nr:hypothetical protein [Tanacetum cinerariifolium]
MEKFMSKRIETEGRIKKKFKEQDRHFLGLGCDNIEMDRTVRNVMSNLSGLKKLVKGLSDPFAKYERSKVSYAKTVLEKELVNERNGKDVAIADAAIATSGIDDDDDDDTAPMDSQPHEPRGSPSNRAKGPNVAPVARECTFADFMKCSPITFRGNEGAAEMKVMMTGEFCPPKEIQRMEGELWNLRVKEMDISSYTTRFNELVILCPGMVSTKRKKVAAYIRGLSENIKGEVTSSEPATLNKAVRMAHTLMEQKVKAIAEREADNKNRKWENFQGGSSSGGGNNNTRDCWSKVVATGANAQLVVTCYGCGEKGHIKTNCPARNNQGRGGARAQAYALRDGDQNLGPNVVTGTFLLNNRYARVLFDSG